jgi:flagellin
MPAVDLTRIGSNIGAMYSLQSLLDINNKLAATQTRLSTGKRINSAADDPAGLTIATKMNARSQGLRVVMDNISDSKNMLSVAESGLSKLTDILVQMRSKANQAASDTLGTVERQTIQSQLQAFAAQVDDIINETKWNGVKLLDGSVSKTFQTGVDEGETTSWQLSQKHDAYTLGIAEKKSAVDLTQISADSAFVSGSAGVQQSSTSSLLNSIRTGTYTLEVADMASGSTVAASGSYASAGTINLNSSNPTGFNSLTKGTAAGSGLELASGKYSLEITGKSTTGGSSLISYSVKDLAGTEIAKGTNTDISSGSVSVNSATTSGSSVGLDMAVNFGSIQVGAKLSFEYIKTGDVKVQLKDSSGLGYKVLDNGNLSSGKAADAMYVATSGNANFYDSGVGFKFKIGTWANTGVGQKMSFDFEEAGQYSVNVSTASKAAAYMTKATSALDIVNQSMADLGSLMARMTIKEEAASSAQINVESAYNRIMNADMAEEQVNASKYMVLQQTAVAMLAQANQAPQFLLSLFK